MSQTVTENIANIPNPNTGKSLGEENRIKDIQITDLVVSVTYERSGISPDQKREIESEVRNIVKAEWNDDRKVLVKTVSPQTEQPAPEQQANLKAGHAAPASKRKVENVKNIIAVSSCKGGVGKSTLAVNFALAMVKQGKKVGLIDADVYGPSLPILLGARGAKPAANGANKMLPIEVHGLKFLSFGLFISEEDPVIWRGPMLGGILNQFLFDADWGELDYLIIDLPPGTGDMQLSMVQATDIQGAIIVSTPQTVALHDTKKGIGMFQKVNVPIIGMVENMSYFIPEDAPEKKYYIFGQEGVKKACEAMDIDYLGEIPLLTPIREGGDQGTPFMSLERNQDSDTWKSFVTMAEKVEACLAPNQNTNKDKGFLGRIFS